MSPLGNIVVLWGGALLFLNVLYDPIFSTLRSSVISGNVSGSDLNTSPVHMVLVGLLTLIVASFLANNNPRVAKAIMAALAGLTILWLISYNKDKAAATAGTPITTQPPISANAATTPNQPVTTASTTGNNLSQPNRRPTMAAQPNLNPNAALSLRLNPNARGL
jgi:hypothetical protein